MSYIDTDKVIEKGKKIQKLAGEYKLLINKLFVTLLDTNSVWIGRSAKTYNKLISLDKEDFLNYGNNIEQFGKYLEKVGTKSNDVISSVSRKER